HQGKEMYRARKLKRTAIIVAGPAANFLLAFIIYVVLGLAGLEYAPARIGAVLPDSAAARGGLRSGDEVLAISVGADGDDTQGESQGGERPIKKWEEMRGIISRSANVPLQLTVRRDQRLLTIELVPDDVGGAGRAGIGLDFEQAVITVSEGSVASLAGMESGDKITALEYEGQRYQVSDFSQLLQRFSQLITASSDDSGGLRIHYLRQGEELVASLPRGETLAELGITSTLLTIDTVHKPAVGVLQPHDQLLAIAGEPIANFYQLSEKFQDQRQPQIEVEVLRAGERMTMKVELEAHEVQRIEGAVTLYTLPVTYVGTMQRPQLLMEEYGLLGSLWFGAQELWQNSGQVVAALAGLFTGSVPLQALGGPILIAKVAGDSAKAGWKMYLLTMAIISINLGVINLCPIPVLDGGQLMLVGMEAVRRRRLQMTTIENFQRLGFVMVLCLIVLATYNDLSRFWRTFLKGITGYFE
ncbi:MAG: site-2 protease family protein, partial [Pseudomonadota bacterium]|nr:site-2 protease family protein [Pseudomonadota bacterium]